MRGSEPTTQHRQRTSVQKNKSGSTSAKKKLTVPTSTLSILMSTQNENRNNQELKENPRTKKKKVFQSNLKTSLDLPDVRKQPMNGAGKC